MSPYYLAERPKIKPEYQIVKHCGADYPEDMTTGILKLFSALEDGAQYSTGGQLSGCTTLFVISRKGIYAAHFFENVSFDADSEWLESSKTGTNEEIFQITVIDILTNGGNYQPKLDASLIEDDYVKAYLLRPAEA
ncbi:uncharacterized protein N7458_008572 [Penicillium daleae]|uniref:Uncharacterized protein n=1 Tax=Penicillium daleae TaxID=63821 RepID=A0AAD6G259_9EURO|nr:uncharacterized protein N7458_008572 [Penicillium daleae]KAJ5444700.1 hypothetical protein N7458_008572 [Penicillium daleae]